MTGLDGALFSPFLCLLPQGVVGGRASPLHRSWRVEDGRLLLMDMDDVVTTVFDDPRASGGGAHELRGALKTGGGLGLVLTRTAYPVFDNTAGAGQNPDIFLEAAAAPKRPNVVVICANANSKHNEWRRDIADEDRNWDLCVTRYDVADAPPPPYEYLAFQPKTPKFTALHRLFYAGSPLWNYRYIWFPDDDLTASWREINRLFAVCKRSNLDLAQPSLTPGQNVNHPVTAQDNRYGLRFSRFVELMCPVFSRGALEVCLPTFQNTKSAFGLDDIWPKLLGHLPMQTGIVDAVTVTHTRPLGTNYDIGAAINEGRHMRTMYGVEPDYNVVGAMLQPFATTL